MSRRFKIERDYYDNGEMLYQKKHVTFKPGLTVLVGCNGCGKTTLMRQIRLQVEKDLKNQCVLNFNNEHDGGQSSIQKSLFYGDMKFVASGLTSSEGERIALNMQKIATQIGTMLQKYQNENEFWIFLDGIDSGFSVDAIVDLKRGLFDTIFETCPDKNIYIIVSANEYEMARDEMCFDVVSCRYVNIKSYNRYRNLVLKSREYKDARIESAIKKRAAEVEAPGDSSDDNSGNGHDSITEVSASDA